MIQRRHQHDSRLRLLVESDDPAALVCDFVAFSDAGFDVIVCSGPAADHECPALDGRPCELVEDSDVVLDKIGDADARRALIDAVRAVAPHVPVVAPSGTTSVNGQTAAVRRAATRSDSSL